jgi:hypothetical protein
MDRHDDGNSIFGTYVKMPRQVTKVRSLAEKVNLYGLCFIECDNFFVICCDLFLEKMEGLV